MLITMVLQTRAATSSPDLPRGLVESVPSPRAEPSSSGEVFKVSHYRIQTHGFSARLLPLRTAIQGHLQTVDMRAAQILHVWDSLQLCASLKVWCIMLKIHDWCFVDVFLWNALCKMNHFIWESYIMYTNAQNAQDQMAVLLFIEAKYKCRKMQLCSMTSFIHYRAIRAEP